tara:strand:- start:140 stop:835 length:696 start_codon:yes stop_codon:yes gene_type:complete
MKEIPYDNGLSQKQVTVVHEKRERSVFHDSKFYYKIWKKDWEHSRVTRHAFNIGYYDESIVPAFDSMIVDADGVDMGYCMLIGKLAGRTNKSWSKLVQKTTYEQRVEFLLTLLEKSMEHEMTVADMAPQNVVMIDGKISLIDLEGLCSFSWLFEQQPQSWEAQNRNLKKCPNPTWRDMSKYLKLALDEWLDISVEGDINNRIEFKSVYEYVKNLPVMTQLKDDRNKLSIEK